MARAAADLLAEEVAAQREIVLALPDRAHPDPVLRRAGGAACRRPHRPHARPRLQPGRARPAARTTRAPSAPSWQQHAWERTGLRRDRCDIPDGAAPDLEAECLRYERAITDAGGIGVAILGVGVDGHIAYNMPGPMTPGHPRHAPAGRPRRLPRRCRRSDWPLRAITMGIGTIRAARRILVLATGETKATAVQAARPRARRSGLAVLVPAQPPDLDLIVDRAAASSL